MELLKDDVLQLMQKADNTICKLRDLHVNCKSSDRQNVKLACELVSDTNATLLLELFPGEKRKKVMAYVFDLLNKSFNLLTSNRRSKNTEYWQSSYGMYLEEQLKLL